MTKPGRKPSDPAARFWPKVDMDGPNGCWIWTAGKHELGYGRFYCNDRGGDVQAHRWAYEQRFGPIPDELDLDHLCRTPSCVNPDHLEPVTHDENVRRGISPSAIAARKTHCKHGHPLSGENLLIHRGARVCRACKLASGRRTGDKARRRRGARVMADEATRRLVIADTRHPNELAAVFGISRATVYRWRQESR